MQLVTEDMPQEPLQWIKSYFMKIIQLTCKYSKRLDKSMPKVASHRNREQLYLNNYNSKITQYCKSSHYYLKMYAYNHL